MIFVLMELESDGTQCSPSGVSRAKRRNLVQTATPSVNSATERICLRISNSRNRSRSQQESGSCRIERNRDCLGRKATALSTLTASPLWVTASESSGRPRLQSSAPLQLPFATVDQARRDSGISRRNQSMGLHDLSLHSAWYLSSRKHCPLPG